MDSLSRLPLYLQVKNYITSMIDSGDYPADSKLPTEKELMETINRFLEEMSPKDRNIFVRRYWFLDPVSVISKRHHMSVGSVKMNLYRNRKKLMKLLEKEGGRI